MGFLHWPIFKPWVMENYFPQCKSVSNLRSHKHVAEVGWEPALGGCLHLRCDSGSMTALSTKWRSTLGDSTTDFAPWVGWSHCGHRHRIAVGSPTGATGGQKEDTALGKEGLCYLTSSYILPQVAFPAAALPSRPCAVSLSPGCAPLPLTHG